MKSEVEYNHENDDLVEIFFDKCSCPDWDKDPYGPPFGNICVACGLPIENDNQKIHKDS